VSPAPTVLAAVQVDPTRNNASRSLARFPSNSLDFVVAGAWVGLQVDRANLLRWYLTVVRPSGIFCIVCSAGTERNWWKSATAGALPFADEDADGMRLFVFVKEESSQPDSRNGPEEVRRNVCPLCGGGEFDLLRLMKDLETPLFTCRASSCGLTIQRRYSRGEFSGTIYQSRYIEQYRADPVAARMRTAEAEWFVGWLGSQGVSLGSSIEIGLGDGTFSGALQRAGIRTAGVDFIPVALELAARQGTKPLHCGDWETWACPHEAEFDVGVMIHTIEHFGDPRSAFTKLVRAVRPGGYLYVHTPNHDHARGSDWFHYWPEHVSLFGRQSLRRLFVSSRVEVCTVRELYGDDLIFIGRKV